MDIFQNLFSELDAVLNNYVNEAVVAAASYVDGPIATLGTITFLLMGLTLLLGLSEFPLRRFLQVSGTLALVFAVAGTAAHFNTYLGDHVRALPDELLGTFAVGGATGSSDDIGKILDQTAQKALTGINAIWSGGGMGWNLGWKFLAVVLFVIFALFGVAATIALGIAKIGLSLVVAVGPLMVLGILFRATQEYFTKWVSYAVQFAVLAMFVGGVAGITEDILTHYIATLETPGDTVDLNSLLAPVIILLILAWIFGQLPNMASSLSGGIGLAVGNTAWNGIRRATAGTLHHAGGKHLDAWRDAARWRRVRRAEALHESTVALRRRIQDRVLHGRNEVTATATAGTKSLQQQAREHVEARRRRRSGG